MNNVKTRKFGLISMLIFVMLIFALTSHAQIWEEKASSIENENSVDIIPKNDPKVYISCDIDMDGNGNFLKAWPLVYFRMDNGLLEITPLNGDTITMTSGTGFLFFFWGIAENNPEMIIHGSSVLCYIL